MKENCRSLSELGNFINGFCRRIPWTDELRATTMGHKVSDRTEQLHSTAQVILGLYLYSLFFLYKVVREGKI